MKKTVLAASAALVIISHFAAAEEPASLTHDPASIGITAGIEYMSNYLWRGGYWYEKDGAFFPYLSADIFGSGLELSMAGEISESWVIDGEDYLTDIHALGLAVDYSHSISALLSGGITLAYFRMKNNDNSFASGTAFLTVETLLNPYLAYTHDYYFDSEEKNDFYIQLGVSHEFDLTADSIVEISLVGGYYRAESADLKGISDIELAVSPSIESGGVSFYSGFSIVYVPSKDYYLIEDGDKDRIRFYTLFGSSYSF